MKNGTLLFAILLLSFGCKAQSELDKALGGLSTDLQEKLKNIGKKNIAVMDIADINKATNTAGKYMSDVIAVNLINNPGYFRVVDRQNSDQIIKEQKLNYQGFIDATTAKKLGKILAVDALVIGTYTVFSDKITLTLKVIDVENATAIAAVMKSIGIDNDLQSLLGKGNNKEEIGKQESKQEIKWTPVQSWSTPSRTNQNNSVSTPLEPECSQKKHGDFCFTNSYSFYLHIDYVIQVDKYFNGQQMVIPPGKTQCLYNLPIGAYRFVAYDHNTGNQSEEGQFLVEQCKSKSKNFSQ